MHNIDKYLPLIGTLRNYDRARFAKDLAAGLTVAVMLVPQGMAYAMLAGLPPIVGLYASVLPVVVYALFGTSRQLAVGPVAMVSLLTATSVGALAEVGTASYLAMAVALALLVGGLQVVMGVFRLGFLVNFLSHPVLSGFTSAAAIIIGLSQLAHLLGVELPRGQGVFAIILAAVESFNGWSGPTIAIGGVSLVLLFGLRAWKRSFPGALVVVTLGILVVWGLRLDRHGVGIVGAVPAGFPAFAWPSLDGATMKALGPTALIIALVGFMESISVAKVFASKNRYEIDANQELIGLGGANVVGALFGAYPVTGGFSRTAVNGQAGAQTTVASLITAGFVALTLLFLTPLFHYLPKSVLAAIIMSAVVGLVDVHEVFHLWKVKRSELALWAMTFLATLSWGIEQGILTGVGASLLWFVVRTTRPHFAVLGRLPEGAFRNVENHSEARVLPGVLMIRMDAQFYFGNVSFLREKLRTLEAASIDPLRHVIIDASAMNQLDSSAASALHELAEGYEARHVALHLANVKRPVEVVLERSGFVERFGGARMHLTMSAAVAALGAKASEWVAPSPSEPSFKSPGLVPDPVLDGRA